MAGATNSTIKSTKATSNDRSNTGKSGNRNANSSNFKGRDNGFKKGGNGNNSAKKPYFGKDDDKDDVRKPKFAPKAKDTKPKAQGSASNDIQADKAWVREKRDLDKKSKGFDDRDMRDDDEEENPERRAKFEKSFKKIMNERKEVFEKLAQS